MKGKIKHIFFVIGFVMIISTLFFSQKTTVRYGFPEATLTGKEAQQFINLYDKAVKYDDEGYSDNGYLNNWCDFLVSQKGSDTTISVCDLNLIIIDDTNYYVDPFDEFFCYCRQLDNQTDYQLEITWLLKGKKYVLKQNNYYKICFIVIDGNVKLKEIADMFEDSLNDDLTISEYGNDFNVHTVNGEKYKYEMRKIEHTDNYYILKSDALANRELRKKIEYEFYR